MTIAQAKRFYKQDTKKYQLETNEDNLKEILKDYAYIDGERLDIADITKKKQKEKIKKRILLKYKESLVKSIDQAIEIACDDKRKCKI